MKQLGILCVSTTVEDAAAKFAAATTGGNISISGYGLEYKTGSGKTGTAQFGLVGGESLKHPFSPLSGRHTLKSVMGLSISSALEGHKDLPDTLVSKEDPNAQPMAYAQVCECGTVSVSTNASLLQHCVACSAAQSMESDGEIRLVSESADDDQDDAEIGDEDTLLDDEEDSELIDDDLSDGADIDDSELIVTQADIDALDDDSRSKLAADLADVLGEDVADIDLTDIEALDDNQREQLTVLFYDDLDEDDGDDDTSESRQDGPAGVAHDPAEVVADIPFFQKKEVEKAKLKSDSKAKVKTKAKKSESSGCTCPPEGHSQSCDAVNPMQVANAAGAGYEQLCADVKEIIGSEADCKTEAGEVYVPEHMRDTVLDGLVAHGWKLDHEELYKGDVRVQITEAVGHRMRLSTSGSPEGAEGAPNTADTNMLGQPEEAPVETVTETSNSAAKPVKPAKAAAPKVSTSGDEDEDEDDDEDDEDEDDDDKEVGMDDMLSVSSMQTLDQSATPMTSAVVLARSFTSVSADQPKWVLLVDGFPVAGCSDLSAQAANADVAQMIDQPQDFEAVALAAMNELGIAEGAASIGFQPYEMPLPIKRVVENLMSESRALMAQQYDAGLDGVRSEFKDAVSMSFMGMNTDFFPEAIHPLKSALFTRMASIAVSCGLADEQAASMVATAINDAFAESGPNFGQTLVSHAMDLMAMPEQARSCIQSNIVAHARAQGQTVTAELSKS